MKGKARGGLSSLLFRSSFENNQYALTLSFMSGSTDTSSIFALACSILGASASSKKRKDFSKCWATKQHSNSERRVCFLQHSVLCCCFFPLSVILCFQATISVGNLRVRLLFCFHSWINFLPHDFYHFLSRGGYSLFSVRITMKGQEPSQMRTLFCSEVMSPGMISTCWCWYLQLLWVVGLVESPPAMAQFSSMLAVSLALVVEWPPPQHASIPSSCGASHWPGHWLGSSISLDFVLFCGSQQLPAPFPVLV